MINRVGAWLREGRRWPRWLAEAAIVLGVLAGIHAWQVRTVPSGAAPTFEGILADGRPIRLDSWRRAHPGRASGIYVWAVWCPVCRAVQGNVDAVGRDWPVLTVAMQSGNAAEIAAHLRARGLDWTTIMDGDGHLAARYGVRAVPAFIVIDPAGAVRFAEMGYTTEAGMRLRLWWAENF